MTENAALTRQDYRELDREITQWGHQGFDDISAIVHDSKQYPDQTPVLDEGDPIRNRVTDMQLRDGDLFVYIDTGEILHYRMTVTRL